MNKPQPKDYGWIEPNPALGEEGGWMLEGGEEAYEAAMDAYHKEVEVIDCEGSGYQDQYEFKLPNGKKIVVGKLSTDFFEKIRALPVPTKLEMMNITIDDMRAAFKEHEQMLISATKLIFGSKWMDRENGIPISFADATENEYRFGLRHSSRSIIALMESGKLDVFKSTDAIFDFIRKECRPKVLKGKITQFDTAHFRLIQGLI